MRETAQIKLRAQSVSNTTPFELGVLQRKCACGQQSGSGECEECQEKNLQRKATSTAGGVTAPPIVHEVVSSPGQALDTASRTMMEGSFGHDFSRVRVHTDARAAESADAVNALAYTVGAHIAFASGRYAPSTGEGRRLLAHELAHTIQQQGAAPRGLSMEMNDAAEQEAEHASHAAGSGLNIAIRSRQHATVARQGPGQPVYVPPPVVEENEEDKERRRLDALTSSKPERSQGGTWGWGGAETKNLYHTCTVPPLKREEFKTFVKSLPKEQRKPREKPLDAEEVLGVTTYNAGNAKAPEIAAYTVQDDKGRPVYKLKPTHAEMPPIRSAYTQAGEYIEGFEQNINEDCKGERMRLGTSKFPIHWNILPDGAAKIREGEQEHCNDIRAAFDLTLGLYASAINNLAASERTYGKEDEVIKDGVRAAGVKPEEMIYNFHLAALKTRIRDDSDWHTAKVHRKNASLDNSCQNTAVVDAASWPQIGPHPSSEVMDMAGPAKPQKP